MKSITLDAPAKINLYLDVISKRSDSYHNISTIFHRLTLSDKVKVSIARRGISVCSDSAGIPSGKGNLAYKAAYCMKKEFGLKSGADIFIKKRIPVAAGLGGGSSDAASVILAFNRLFNLNAKPAKLINIARKIGADVPFFVSGYKCATGKGIGDCLKQIKCYSGCPVLLLVPNIHIYTKTIYRRLTLPLTKPAMSVNLLARTLSRRNGLIRAADYLYNRLEDVVLPLYPIVRKGRDALSLYTKGTLLSGSGPSVFGMFKKRKEALQAAREIRNTKKWQLFLTEAG